jgi:hypothetical protein
MGGPTQLRRPREAVPPAAVLVGLTSLPVEADRGRRLEVPEALGALLPHGGPRRGTTVGIGAGAAPGACSLALALVSAASQAGRWVAVVGEPALGPVAAAQYGLRLDQLALVPDPGPQWAVVAAALLESIDVVVVRLPGRARPADARRLVARARERGAVLVILGEGWPEAPELRLAVTAVAWEGLAVGHGHLQARRVEVAVSGRRAGPDRQGWLWLPGPDGRVAPAVPGVAGAPSVPAVPDAAVAGGEAVAGAETRRISLVG